MPSQNIRTCDAASSLMEGDVPDPKHILGPGSMEHHFLSKCHPVNILIMQPSRRSLDVHTDGHLHQQRGQCHPIIGGPRPVRLQVAVQQ